MRGPVLVGKCVSSGTAGTLCNYVSGYDVFTCIILKYHKTNERFDVAQVERAAASSAFSKQQSVQISSPHTCRKNNEPIYLTLHIHRLSVLIILLRLNEMALENSFEKLNINHETVTQKKIHKPHRERFHIGTILFLPKRTRQPKETRS